ncbi:uncharacterized protein FFB20_13408 [Fusarium fujikuroi]|uniref:AB hydrolase-1 domain-containing protein n=2 Tax=Fusarium fujikuroi TaxID=5127 RepID=S0DRW5_GIBF5|nr:uncharacterized protein FFUJ_02101 [Fusarium fujikuroi IMI 58289]KLP15816.1 uncharacterized protein LW94_627 [Fusarium fujikuroi]QGI61340.1 hypothetical protein CEK27_005311 [Fusarium fujikuroi]QGI78521.1 hypothetical protein CEK25_005250 [Fusarium fujikuroi]QGI92238.1 hypothetical protein CEK26_005307 [Fusarium fujikuroi]CCT65180.1 uncharacterized protein FFUJ_02101 [Fusarium fujikuroi IMI 58289]
MVPAQGSASSPTIGAQVWPADAGDDATTVDVVFVHGLRGNPINTWSKKDGSGTSVCWPRDLLRGNLKTARVISWGYDTDIANVFSRASEESLFGHAQKLLGALSRLRNEVARPILWVGHSLGGLVIKEVIILAASYKMTERYADLGSMYHATIGIIFLGTPHRGSDKESLGQIIATVAKATLRRPNEQLLATLASDSHVLEKQRHNFISITKDLPVFCSHEELPMHLIGMVLPSSLPQ